MLCKLLLFFACPIMLLSCTGATSSSNDHSHSSDTSNSSETPAPNTDATLNGTAGIFSYTINGQDVVTRNNVSRSNLFINEVSNGTAAGTLKIKVTCEGSNVFTFQISNHGTTTISNDGPSLSSLSGKEKSASYMDGRTYKNLHGDPVTVAITSISDTRVMGTFSGTFKEQQDNGTATVNITNGSFNLPFVKN